MSGQLEALIEEAARRGVERALAAHREQLVVSRVDAARLLDVSGSTFGRLVRDGHVRAVPHLRPPKYSVELLRRFARGEAEVFTDLG